MHLHKLELHSKPDVSLFPMLLTFSNVFNTVAPAFSLLDEKDQCNLISRTSNTVMNNLNQLNKDDRIK